MILRLLTLAVVGISGVLAQAEESELLVFDLMTESAVMASSTTTERGAHVATTAILSEWRSHRFGKVSRTTLYTIVRLEDEWVLEARADRSASALLRDVVVDPRKTRFVSWEWRVSKSLEAADCTSKSGDDCAARIMILYRYDPNRAGFFERRWFEREKARTGKYPPGAMLVYGWVEGALDDAVVTSPYSDRVRLIPVRRGDKVAGKWVAESRNHLEDYRRAFGEDPPPVEAVAIMVDTDNTETRTVSWFRSVALSSKDSKKADNGERRGHR